MSRIRVTPDHLDEVAAQFRQGSQESEAMVNQLTQAIRGMQGDWEGMTSQKFYQDFDQWSQTMRHFVEVLGGIEAQLRLVSDRFRQADLG